MVGRTRARAWCRVAKAGEAQAGTPRNRAAQHRECGQSRRRRPRDETGYPAGSLNRKEGHDHRVRSLGVHEK